ncbi:cyclase family protein [bacterium]|nr:cyclase family protein [bacterium]
MKLIDLSHFISENMPVYPGTESPKLVSGCSVEVDGFLEKKITMFSHTGTHMDAPSHLLIGGKMLDQLPLDQFYGSAFLLKLEDSKSKIIGIEELKPHTDQFNQVDFLVVNTGWSQYWRSDQYFSDYPVFSLAAAEWLTRFNFKGIGLDMISIDEISSHELPIHKVFLQKGTLILENLTNLDLIPGNRFTLSCFPLKIEDADGSPIRAVAIV